MGLVSIDQLEQELKDKPSLNQLDEVKLSFQKLQQIAITSEERAMKHINSLREETDNRMQEIFSKFQIVQEKLDEFESDDENSYEN